VFATESLLQHTHICVRTVVISSVVRNTHAGNSLLPTSDFWQLQDVAGRRGVDAEGTVVSSCDFFCGGRKRQKGK
jgi:superfamily II RNA helicase